MKNDVAAENKELPRYFSTAVAGLMVCTVALHANNVRATESRTFSVVGSPATATYRDGASEIHTVASNAVRIMVKTTERDLKSVSTASTQRISSLINPDGVVQWNKFNDSAHSPTFLIHNGGSN